MKTYKPNDFNHKCQIGRLKTETTSTGGKIEKFDENTAHEVWFASKLRTIALQFQLLGTQYEDTFEIVVRHQSWLREKLVVKFKGELYSILNISSDETSKIQRFDIITLRKKTKGK
ncbi:phage head closure protein [Lactococcus lactis]